MGGKELIPSLSGSGGGDRYVLDSDGVDVNRGSFQLLKVFRFSKGFKVEISAILVRNLIFLSSACKWVLIPFEMDLMSKVLIIQAAMPAGILRWLS